MYLSSFAYNLGFSYLLKTLIGKVEGAGEEAVSEEKHRLKGEEDREPKRK